MFEKVNPAHPDKIADRIAGAMVDKKKKKEKDPRIAVEVLIGHGSCRIISETSVHISYGEVASAVERIAGQVHIDYCEVPQDRYLAENQKNGFRCGDNGIFRGVPVTEEQINLTRIALYLYEKYGSDGKYIISDDRSIICQSNADTSEIALKYPGAEINPLGNWSGGSDVDCGATNRKLGSDMGDAVTGGGLHGKDLSKADVSLNICAYLSAKECGHPVEYICAIGDSKVNGIPYSEYVEIAREYISEIGGFEKFAEWGLIRGNEIKT